MSVHDPNRLPKMFRTRMTARAARDMDPEILATALTELYGLNLTFDEGSPESHARRILDKVSELAPVRPRRPEGPPGPRPELPQ